MSKPFGWRTLDTAKGPEWVEGKVCAGCQVFPRELFAPGTKGAHGGPWGTDMANVIAERLLEVVDWPSYQVATGSALAVARSLRDLLSSSNVEEASAAWEGIEEYVFSQGTIYSAAEPAVSVMLAALTEEQPPWRSGRILDLLFFIVTGYSGTDPSLQARCRDRAREGLWLLAQWVVTHEGWARDNALEVVEVIAPDRCGLLRLVIAGR